MTMAMSFANRLPLRSTGQYSHNVKAKSIQQERIKIRLHHTGLVSRAPLIGQRRQEVEDFLTDVWSQFGVVAKTHYDRDFKSVVVTYKTRGQTFLAMNSLRDPIEVSVAIQAAVGADFERSSLSRQLFRPHHVTENLITPSYHNTGVTVLKHNGNKAKLPF